MQLLKRTLNFLKNIDMHVSPTGIFIIKCLVITLCINYIAYNNLPRYHFLNSKTRVNKVTGVSEYYYDAGYCQGWKE